MGGAEGVLHLPNFFSVLVFFSSQRQSVVVMYARTIVWRKNDGMKEMTTKPKLRKPKAYTRLALVFRCIQRHNNNNKIKNKNEEKLTT